MNSVTLSSNLERCWDIIGVTGDRSCPQLPSYAHCRNCLVYSAAGRQLLERPTLENYRHEWTQLLAESRSVENSPNSSALLASETLKVVIFRLQREWLALPAQIFKEIASPSQIHTIPHRRNQILRGLINIRGEMLLCVTLNHLLHIEAVNNTMQTVSAIAHSRMVVVEKPGNTWVFAVDELYGIHRLHRQELRDAPRHQAQAYAQGIFSWHGGTVTYLDDELLFTSLARKVQ